MLCQQTLNTQHTTNFNLVAEQVDPRSLLPAQYATHTTSATPRHHLMPSSRRGQRNAAKEVARLPAWANALLATLRALANEHRRSALRLLRFIHNLLEQEWKDDLWESDAELDVEAQPPTPVIHNDAFSATPAPGPLRTTAAPPTATIHPPWAKRSRS